MVIEIGSDSCVLVKARVPTTRPNRAQNAGRSMIPARYGGVEQQLLRICSWPLYPFIGMGHWILTSFSPGMTDGHWRRVRTGQALYEESLPTSPGAAATVYNPPFDGLTLPTSPRSQAHAKE
jgi:hypothetical protein